MGQTLQHVCPTNDFGTNPPCFGFRIEFSAQDNLVWKVLCVHLRHSCHVRRKSGSRQVVLVPVDSSNGKRYDAFRFALGLDFVITFVVVSHHDLPFRFDSFGQSQNLVQGQWFSILAVGIALGGRSACKGIGTAGERHLWKVRYFSSVPTTRCSKGRCVNFAIASPTVAPEHCSFARWTDFSEKQSAREFPTVQSSENAIVHCHNLLVI